MISLEEMQTFLPSYLTPQGREELFKQLAKFGDDGSWQPYGTGSVYPTTLLQGDGVRGMQFVSLPSMKTRIGEGLILSNTCDIDPENPRKFSAYVTYCPLVPADKFEAVAKKLYEGGAVNFIKDARAQGATSVIFFPEAAPNYSAYYGLLDQACHIRRDVLPGDFAQTSKVFTLSQVGFYLFLTKLSIHFTRIHEGIARDKADAA